MGSVSLFGLRRLTVVPDGVYVTHLRIKWFDGFHKTSLFSAYSSVSVFFFSFFFFHTFSFSSILIRPLLSWMIFIIFPLLHYFHSFTVYFLNFYPTPTVNFSYFKLITLFVILILVYFFTFPSLLSHVNVSFFLALRRFFFKKKQKNSIHIHFHF